MRNDPACRGERLFRLPIRKVEFRKQVKRVNPIRDHTVRMEIGQLGSRDIPQHFVISPRDIPEHRVAADPHPLTQDFIALPVAARFVQRKP